MARLHLELNPPPIRALKPQNKTLFQLIQSCQKINSSFHWRVASETAGQPSRRGRVYHRQGQGSSGRQQERSRQHMARRGGGGGSSKAAPGSMFPSLLMPARALTHCSNAGMSTQLQSPGCAQHLQLSCLCPEGDATSALLPPRFHPTQLHPATVSCMLRKGKLDTLRYLQRSCLTGAAEV